MARHYRGLASFLLFSLVGALAGAILGTLTDKSLLKWRPPRFEATIVLFHPSGSGMSDSGRDFVALSLAQPEFLPSAATRHGWDANMAAEVASNVSVVAANAAGPVAELRLSGTDPTTLVTTLNLVAERMIEWHRDKQMMVLQSQLSELDAAFESAKRSEEDLVAARSDDTRLPSSAHSAISAMTDLARQRRQLELAARYQLRRESSFDTLRRQQRLTVVLAKEARLNKSIGDKAGIASTQFENEHAIAVLSAERLAVQETKARLQREFESVQPLQIVQRAAVNQISRSPAPAQLLMAVGSFIGALIGGFVWSKRRSSPGKLSDLVGVDSRLPPTMGVIGETLTEYGVRELRPLAETDPGHLVLAGIHSLHVALYVMAQEQDRTGPVVITETGEPQHAAHVVANLAAIAAKAGERVLIVEAFSSPGMLSRIFTSDKQITTPGGEKLAAEHATDAHPGTERIRFLFYDLSTNELEEETLPVIDDFDRLLIHVGNVALASDLLDVYGTGIGLLVCSGNARLPASIEDLEAIHGIVLCDYRIDPSVYS